MHEAKGTRTAEQSVRKPQYSFSPLLLKSNGHLATRPTCCAGVFYYLDDMSTPEAAASVSSQCEHHPRPSVYFTAGVFYYLDDMSTPEAAASASDCAARCSTTQGCDAYNFCPLEATEG